MAKTIVITGASKGIGLVIARRLMAAGHRVVGTSRNPLQVSHVDVPLLALDLNDPASVKAFVPQVLETVGRIDVLINNAGFDLYGAAEETSPEELAWQMETNFTSLTRLVQAVLPVMRQQGGGQIINMGSLGGLIALPYNSAYAASKFALEGYTEALRLELLAHQIYVSLVEPGAVRTETLDASIQSVAQVHPVFGQERMLMIQRMREMGRKSQVTPEHVAATVLEIVAAKRPKLRYPVGGTAFWAPLLKALLPQGFFERFMIQQFLMPVKAMARSGSPYQVGEFKI